jgi:hypothetical protein
LVPLVSRRLERSAGWRADPRVPAAR